MRIRAFQTGARYSADGQRIAYAPLLHHMEGYTLVGFYDVDRHVYNVVKIVGEPTDEKVHQEYLNCRYVREVWIPGPVQDALREAASKVPSIRK